MATDGDSGFIGLDMQRDPAVVAKGYYTKGENVVCQDGTVSTRKGCLMVPWGTTVSIPEVIKGDIVAEGHPDALDMIEFRDPSKQRTFLVVATLANILLCRPGTTALVIPYPPGYVPSDRARLIQAYDKVFLLGGDSKRPLVWDGDIDEEFVYADEGTVGGGFVKFPQTGVGCYHKNRLWVKGEDPNQVYPSDILDETDFYVGNEFFVNQGDNDEVRALIPYTNDRIICFKGNSIYSLDNLQGDLIANAEINLVTRNAGIISDKSAQVVGQNIIWLSRKGVYMAQIAYEQRLSPDITPLSDPIQPAIDRINWAHAHKAVSAIYENKYLLAVPLDDNNDNSAVLVYDLRNQAWESVDLHLDHALTFESGASYTDNLCPRAMASYRAFGKEVLVSMSLAGGLVLYRYNEGHRDTFLELTDDVTAWITANWGATEVTRQQYSMAAGEVCSIVITRGYLGTDVTSKYGCFIDITVDTFDPKWNLTVVTPGPGETVSIMTNRTHSRTQRLDYVNSAVVTAIDNASNSHQNPYLEDYSVPLGLDCCVVPAVWNDNPFYFGAGEIDPVWLNRHQEFHQRYRIYKRCRAPRLKIKNTSGIVSLKSISVELYSRNKPRRREV